jgi:hypothetical protein
MKNMAFKVRIVVIVLGLMSAIFGTMIKNISQEKDWLMVTYGGWGVRVVNWSPKRKLIATTVIPKDTPVWVPGGWGWYEAGNLEKVQKIEGGRKLMEAVMFYNLGLKAQKIVYSPKNLGVEETLRDWGGSRWWWWKWDGNSWLVRDDPEIETGNDFLTNWDRLVITGYAPAIREPTDWRVFNATPEKGLGSFIAQRLAWGGMWVSSVSNLGDTKIAKCNIKYNLNQGSQEAIIRIKTRTLLFFTN